MLLVSQRLKKSFFPSLHTMKRFFLMLGLLLGWFSGVFLCILLKNRTERSLILFPSADNNKVF